MDGNPLQNVIERQEGLSRKGENGNLQQSSSLHTSLRIDSPFGLWKS